jgi:hypothetical protein
MFHQNFDEVKLTPNSKNGCSSLLVVIFTINVDMPDDSAEKDRRLNLFLFLKV